MSLAAISIILIFISILLSIPVSSDSIELGPFHLSRMIYLGEIATLLSIIGSALVVVGSWYFNEKNKRDDNRKEYADKRAIYIKEYADSIRNSAEVILVKLDYRKGLKLGFFTEIQTTILQLDQIFVKERNKDLTGEITATILDKYICYTYKKAENDKYDIHSVELYILYRYSTVSNDVLSLLDKLNFIDQYIDQIILQLTESDVMQLNEEYQNKKINNNILGNKLRWTLGMIGYLHKDLMDGELDPSRNKLIELINAKDDDIYKQNVEGYKQNVEGYKQNVEGLQTRENENKKREASQCWAIKGLVSLFDKNYKYAIECFTYATEICPSIAGFWAGKGLAQRANGTKDKDEYTFKEAMNILSRKSAKQDTNCPSPKEFIYV